jgi:predicted cupin superfamily sugar epimerase
MDPEQLIEQLGLEPHPEGGFYAETYRAASTAIYYLLTAGDVSAMHRIVSDEIFHFYAGDPVRLLRLYPDGSGDELTIGSRLDRGEQPQVLVPGRVWQGLRLVEGGRFALLGCTVAPGFDFADFELGDPGVLTASYPTFETEIRALRRCGKSG